MTAVAITAVALLGPRAVGKTTVGRALAARLGFAFVDADERLAAATGMAAGEFLQRHGEAAFRAREEQVTVPLLAAERTVVALGGGAVLSAAIRAALARPGLLPVLLLADPAVLLARLEADPTPRPALTGLPAAAEVRALLTARLPLYRAAAPLELDGARPVADLVRELAAIVGGGAAPRR